ncbi:hypothetical protein AVEN_122369-1 [Araneus ventricosus]|uniref:Uncharacterized protein n=1 Tax=Araneus ventricosus TaxID=182803 RepID=A0A4Y2LJE6_ARAVE|nr:hypothetical protein AVEN_122369-1 [Araneus ventricosus]
MDGPNVNLKVLEMMMTEEMKNKLNTSLLNVGTCGLHVMRSEGGCSAAFAEVEEAASAADWLFKDSPAHTEDFASLKPDDAEGYQRWLRMEAYISITMTMVYPVYLLERQTCGKPITPGRKISCDFEISASFSSSIEAIAIHTYKHGQPLAEPEARQFSPPYDDSRGRFIQINAPNLLNQHREFPLLFDDQIRDGTDVFSATTFVRLQPCSDALKFKWEADISHDIMAELRMIVLK